MQIDTRKTYLLGERGVAAAIIERVADRQGDGITGILDQVHYVLVAYIRDVYVIDSENVIADVEPAASLGGRALDYPADRGAGLVDGRDDHEAEALVLHSRHGNVVRILQIHLPAVRGLQILLEMLLRVYATPYSQSHPAVLGRRDHQLHHVVVRRVHDAFAVDGHDEITGVQPVVEIGRSAGDDVTH